MSSPVWHEFDTRRELAQALAASVSGTLADAVGRQGTGLLAVSGGTTPDLFFEALALQDIEWGRVVVTLVDERFVPPASERSNERLVRELLLTHHAAKARFIGLFSQADSVEAAAELASSAVRLWPRPLDVAILGMGTDGHTASFFADADDAEALLENPRGNAVLPVHAASAGEPRLTLSVQTLAKARRLVIHIEGAEKRDVLEAALKAGGQDAPVGRVLAKMPGPVEIYWTAQG
jgi:6-phosphogluconolactonase